MIARIASTALAALALSTASTGALAQAETPTITEETFSSVIFTAFCLATEGNIGMGKERAVRLTTAENPGAMVLGDEDRANLIGESATDAWMFFRPEGEQPVFLSYAKTEGGADVCQVLTLGSLAQMGPIFGGVLDEHEALTSHTITDAGNADFLENPEMTGNSYLVSMSRSSAFVILLEERDETITDDDAILKMVAFYIPNE